MQAVDPEKTDDLTLLLQCREGAHGACERFVARHAPPLLRYLNSLSGNVADAEDALQDVFASIWKRAQNQEGKPLENVRAYLYTSARHALSRRNRLRAGEPARKEDLADLESLGKAAGWGDFEDAEALAARLESVHALRAALGSLAPADQEILVLRDLEGFTAVEAAAILEMEVPAIKSRLLRARLRLAAQLKGEKS